VQQQTSNTDVMPSPMPSHAVCTMNAATALTINMLAQHP